MKTVTRIHQIALMTSLPISRANTNAGELTLVNFTGDHQLFSEVEIICASPSNKLDGEFIRQLPDNIKLIVSIGVGLDHIDLEAANQRNIKVTNTPVVTEDTADLTFALILAATRRLSINEQFLRHDQWSANTPMAALGQSVHSKTLGIIGFGAIGQAVARRAQGFNIKVIYYNPRRKESEEKLYNAKYCQDIDQLLAAADIVSLHCPLSSETELLINADKLAKMKKTSVLINTGRGGLIDEAALISALQNNEIAAAGLDVYQDEPKVTEGLKALDNVTLLPHIGSATVECRTNMLHTALKNIEYYLLGQYDNMNLVIPQ